MKRILLIFLVVYAGMLVLCSLASATTNNGLRNSSGVAQTSIAIPGPVRAGTTSGSSIDLFENATNQLGTWSVRAQVTASLTGPGGATIAPAAIQGQGTAQTSTTWVNLDTKQILQNNIPNGTKTSAAFRFRIVVPATTASGTYTGNIRMSAIDQLSLESIVSVPVTITVVQGALTNNGLKNSSNVSLSSFNFPTTVGKGGYTNSDTYHVTMANSLSTWQLRAQASTFSRVGGGATIGANNLSVYTPAGTLLSLGSQVTIQSNIAMATTTSGNFYFRDKPPAGTLAGDYTGTITLTVYQDSPVEQATVTINATIHVLGYLEIASIRNPAGGTSNITSFDFPTQVQGAVESNSFVVNVTTNANWALYSAVTDAFQKINEPAVVKPTSSFGVHPALGTIGLFTGLGVYRTVFGSIPRAQTASNSFSYVSNNTGHVEAGDYTGTITVMVTAL